MMSSLDFFSLYLCVQPYQSLTASIKICVRFPHRVNVCK